MDRDESLTGSSSTRTLEWLEDARSPRLDICMLGGFDLSCAGRSATSEVWRLSKAQSLIQLLALAPGHRIHREQVLETLWPGADPKVAAGNFYQVIHAARGALESVSPPGTDLRQALQLRTHVIALSPPIELWIDAIEFEKLTRNAVTASDVAAMRSAVAMYKGDLLPEHPYEDWIEPRRQLLRDQCVTLLIELGRAQECAGNYPSALDSYREAAALDPIKEQARAGVMRVEALLGQPASALEEYDRLEDLLNEELGVEPDIELRQLRDDISAGHTPSLVQSPVSAQRESDEPPRVSNLPALLSSFVGREEETVELRKDLTLHRLVTVSGPGGSGKTRLAIEVAKTLCGHFRDGVFYISLTPLSDPALVLPTIAHALGLTERPDRGHLKALQDHLADKHLLLLLDNLEHLLPSRDDIARLLSRCPHITVLVTSRNVLRLSGEKVFVLTPLPVPDRRLHGEVAQVEQYPSVRLFVERARSAKADFDLGPGNAGAIVDVCQRLDGLPLAIELAAARIRLMSPSAMALRLDEPLPLLTDGAYDRPVHQQSLRNTIEWSYDLLSPVEQALFRRLAIFRGGWTLDAAESVIGQADDTGVEREPNVDVINGTAALLDASLVAETDLDDGNVRFTILETIREYGLEQLLTLGELEAIARRHAWYFLEHVESVKSDLNNMKNVESMRGFERDHDNLRTALHWFDDRGMSEPLLRFTTALIRFWYIRGRWREARYWLNRALAINPEPTPSRGYALSGVALFSSMLGDSKGVQPQIDEAIDIATTCMDHEDSVAAICTLGVLKLWQNDLQFSRWALEETLEHYRQRGQHLMVAHNLRMLGELSWRSGDLARAEQELEESARISRQFGIELGLAHSLNGLGDFYRVTERYDRAEETYRESLALFDRCPVRDGRASAVQNLGFVLNVRGEQAEATRLLREAAKVFYEHGDQKGVAECLIGLAGVFLAEDQPANAARLLGAAHGILDLINAQASPSNEKDLGRILSQARHVLGEDRFTSLYKLGIESAYEDPVVEAIVGQCRRSPTLR